MVMAISNNDIDNMMEEVQFMLCLPTTMVIELGKIAKRKEHVFLWGYK
jgi:hypothetical protein